MKRRSHQLLLLGVSAAVSVACSSHTAFLSDEHLGQIEVGVTHQHQVREWFGLPDRTEANESGGVRWTYRRVEPSKKRSLSRLLGSIVVFFPPARGDSPVGGLAETLDLDFAPTGTVRVWSHERTPGLAPGSRADRPASFPPVGR